MTKPLVTSSGAGNVNSSCDVGSYTQSSVIGTVNNWTPASMPNVWTGVDPTTGISSTKWTDGWGLGHDLVVTSGSITTGTLNSRTVPVFSGSSANALKTAANFPQSGDAAWTLCVAFKADSATVDQPLCGFGNVGVALHGAGIYGLANSNYVVAFGGGNSYHPNAALSTNIVLLTAIKSAGAINSTVTFRINGTTVASLGGDSTSTPAIDGAWPLALGQWSNFTGTEPTGKIGAYFAMTAASSLSDVQSLEGYINSLFNPPIY